MKMMKKLLSAVLACALVFGAALSVGASTPDEVFPEILHVTEAEIESYGFQSAVQSALNEARAQATADYPMTVSVPEGEYDLYGALHIYSNTTLSLNGSVLTRAGSGNMLRVGDEDTVANGVTGYAYENIRIVNGYFDGNDGENTIIKAFHTKNFSMEGVGLYNEKDGHMTEFAGVDGLKLRNCGFFNQTLTPGKNGYEAIQLDVLHPYHITNARCEDLPVTNVTIEYCSFENVPRAIGSHTAVHNRPHSNITIRECIFTNISSIAIQGMSWTNVNILSNYIDGAPRGITIYNEPNGNTYLSSKLAAKGGTESHVSDSYQKPAKANINIAYNILYNIGTTDDPYASYASQGIAVLGKKLTAKSAVDSTDESGGLPAGDYYIDGVKIHDNEIDVRGNGIRLEDVRNAEVTSNEVFCTTNTVHRDNYYGIVLRNNVTASSISYNLISGAELNGIQIDCTSGGSVDTIRYNRIGTTGKYGMGIYSATIGTIADNDILYTANDGMHIDNSNVNSITSNRIYASVGKGIWITANTSAALVEKNTTLNCDGNIQYTQSAGKVTVKTNYTTDAKLKSIQLAGMNERSGATMSAGTMFKLTPAAGPVNAFADFAYESSDTDVVQVDDCGMVYAVSEGYATITVTAVAMTYDAAITKTYAIAVEGDDETVSHLASKPAVPILLRGDADGNHEIETIDATIVQRFAAYMDVPCSVYILQRRADIDSDHDINVVDATYIQMYLAGFDTPYDIGEEL